MTAILHPLPTSRPQTNLVTVTSKGGILLPMPVLGSTVRLVLLLLQCLLLGHRWQRKSPPYHPQLRDAGHASLIRAGSGFKVVVIGATSVSMFMATWLTT